MPHLNLVKNQQDSVLVAQPAQIVEEPGRRNHIPAFTLNRLHHDGGHFLRRHRRLEQLPFQQVGADAIADAVRRAVALRAAIRIGIRHVDDARHERTEPAPLHRLAGRKRKRPHGPSVERAEKGNKPMALGVVARNLHRRFHGFGAGIAKGDLLGELSRRDLGHLFRQLRQQRVIEIRPRHVDQGFGLLLDHAHDIGMAMPGGDHGNSGGKIQKEVAINVLDDCALSALGHQRIVASVGRRNVLFVERQNLLGFGPGKRRRNVRQLGFHRVSPLRCLAQRWRWFRDPSVRR